jgi:hypothetical protein
MDFMRNSSVYSPGLEFLLRHVTGQDASSRWGWSSELPGKRELGLIPLRSKVLVIKFIKNRRFTYRRGPTFFSAPKPDITETLKASQPILRLINLSTRKSI